ncbi:MAG: Xaa-Pro dipeptidase [Chloroflexi bacterium HGW-Chloroflexi-1]|nr:MAG: Xaa-Pro dipeptidase [Chloroflexi bacterium HGW-Chloroflexi-1]
MRAALVEADIDALLVSQPENRRYLSGFTGSAGWLLITADQALFATDFRYFEQVGMECPDFELVPMERTFADVLPAMLARAGVRRLGFEADFATFADVQAWSKAAPDTEWAPTKELVIRLRAVKDAVEISALRAAIQLADEALAAALAQAHGGMTERELAWLIESYMRTHGAEAVSFDIIVAGGPNGARPHARATDTPLPAGVPIVIDMGARLNGYCSDITRTICLGEPADPGRFWEVYHTVLRAQQAAEAALRPGMTGQEADAVAREIITEAGYGEYFGHHLGHGVGLAVQEEPRLSRTNTAALAPGNCVTVEPGIYLPGWGGVRIEDIVLITEDGVEVLTAAPKGAIIA